MRASAAAARLRSGEVASWSDCDALTTRPPRAHSTERATAIATATVMTTARRHCPTQAFQRRGQETARTRDGANRKMREEKTAREGDGANTGRFERANEHTQAARD